ncbi:hypothetical protein [Marispirochaeta sp.]|uniref:hypothetical protein n=1 Tax=Marispirochaeta sp. TaxID=2038653 RepID=UPI0029C815BB|nr:hypothetical protein [Marispirochaeta sp.]
MNKIRDIIRLAEASLSQRQIANALNISRPVVADTSEKIKGAGLTYTQIKSMPDSELSQYFIKAQKPSSKSMELKEQFPHYAKELKKTGVTLTHLWEEYLSVESAGAQVHAVLLPLSAVAAG